MSGDNQTKTELAFELCTLPLADSSRVFPGGIIGHVRLMSDVKCRGLLGLPATGTFFFSILVTDS